MKIVTAITGGIDIKADLFTHSHIQRFPYTPTAFFVETEFGKPDIIYS
jgi:hypothetical protein